MTATQEHPCIALDADLVSKLFHELNQPLTSLHCALELGMMKHPVASSERTSLELALKEVQQITNETAMLRERIETVISCSDDDPH